MFLLVASCDDSAGTHECIYSVTSLIRTQGSVLISSVLIGVLISSVLIGILINSVLISEVEKYISVAFGTVKVYRVIIRGVLVYIHQCAY